MNKNKFLIVCTILSTIIYLLWRSLYTLPLEDGMISIVFGVSLFVVEVMGMFEAIVHFYNMSDIEYHKKPNVSKKLFPDVDVFIATYNEPVSLLYKTINGCVNMDYPNKGKVHIYLCDDGNRDEMKKLAEHMKINYIGRSERKGSKAGNFNNAMKHSNSPLIATFDADMIPMHDFLMECVPYFLTKEKIGFIQTPQSFYNPDLFQYNLFSENRIPNEQDYFYRDVQVSRNKSNTVIYGGTNTVILRKALEDVDGFYTKAITEDFATGINIQSKGYKCYAIDETHALGLAPSDLKSLIKQRERWARGCIQTGKRVNVLFKKGLNIKQKLSYLSAISYWYSGIKRLIYIISPILFSVFGVVVVRCNLWQVIIFWLPMYLLSNASLKLLSKNIRTTKWTNVYDTILFPSLIVPVMLETFGISKNKFVVTRKDGPVNDKVYQIKKSIPHVVFAVLSAIGIINCIRLIFNSGSLTYIVLLFWLIINFYNILMSLFFMFGRKINRKSERFPTHIKCSISYDKIKIFGMTYDISEGGVSVLLDMPENIPENTILNINLFSERYSCGFEAETIHVEKVNGKWKYAFGIIKIDENNFKRLLGIIYDRIHGLPRTIDESNSIYDDIRVNVLTRNNKKSIYKRKLPRIELRKSMYCEDYGKIEIMNINHRYIAIKINYKYKELKNIKISICEGIIMECKLEKNLKYIADNKRDRKHGVFSTLIQLYSIKNYNNIWKNSEFREILLRWSEECEDIKNKNSKNKSKNMIPADEFNEMVYL